MILDEILNTIKNSENIAYVENGKEYTYAYLYEIVCKIYNYLIIKNIDKQPVIIIGNKEIWNKAAILACGFAGITYVPIDKTLPIERIKNIKDQVKTNFIIDERNISDIISSFNSNDIEKTLLKLTDVSYIIFTSGTTGVPKGVKVTYENLDSCVNWLKTLVKLRNGVILNQASFSFDLSVADFYLSLITNSKHFILNNNRLDFTNIFMELKTSKANLAVFTPSFADLLMTDKTFNSELLPELETIIFCGETLNINTARKLKERFNNIEIINCYGPTECTFAVTSTVITDEMLESDLLPVGKSKQDVKIYIVDEKKNECEKGEILITGRSVADGYLNIESNAFINYKGSKGYLTGDIGYYKDDYLYCIGRKDNQIKYKGFRIELNDIECNLNRLEYIEKSKVITKVHNNSVQRIIAFVKLNKDISQERIKNDLGKLLPEYMIPSLRIIDDFPINKNGKVDVQKLKELING